MTILWITNILFPEAAKLLVGNGEFKASGGWMLGAATALLQKKDIKLVVACVSSLVSNLTKIEGINITYYVLPLGKGNLQVNSDYIPLWKSVHQEVNPDVVHIYGTEYTHGYAYLKACGGKNVLVSIQGLLSGIYPFYAAGLSIADILSSLTLRDLIKGNIWFDKYQLKKRSLYERELIKMVNHVTGRTLWDKALVWSLNSKTTYHFCNEILRTEFYDNSLWSYHKCVKHSIFLSQGSYPLKGLHQVLKAMPIVLQYFPDTKIRIAGVDITKSNTFYSKLRLSGYGLYIKRLIKKLHLDGKVTFTGNLTAEQMKQEYLQSNVFICPSVIENSPNSLGEAQILGVPTIACYAGGIPDMMKGNEDNLYRFEEYTILAHKINNIFNNKCEHPSMYAVAASRHNIQVNVDRLYDIYQIVKND